MKRHVGMIVAILALYLSMQARAATQTAAIPMDLADAVRLAGERNVSVLISNERVSRALERIKETRSALLPNVSATSSESRQTRNLAAQGLSIPMMPARIGPFDTFDARLALAQPLFDAAAYERFRLARAGVVLSQTAYAKARQDAMALVATLYLSARRAQETLALAQALVRRDEARQRVAQSALSLGTGAEVTEQQAASDLEASRSHLTLVRADAAAKRRDLAAALSLDEEQAIVFSTVPACLVAGEDALKTFMENHPDLRAAQSQVSQDKASHAAERADYWPRASVSADYGASGKELSSSIPTYTLGIGLSLPLFDSGRRSSKVGQAASQVRESELQIEDIRRRLKAEAVSALEDQTQAAQALHSTESLLALAQRQLALARRRSGNGLGRELDVEEAMAAAAVAEDTQRAALAALDIARIRLAKALGKMDLLARKV